MILGATEETTHYVIKYITQVTLWEMVRPRAVPGLRAII